jgi:hypothetical protein
MSILITQVIISISAVCLLVLAWWLDDLAKMHKCEAERYKQLYYQVCRELEEVCSGITVL